MRRHFAILLGVALLGVAACSSGTESPGGEDPCQHSCSKGAELGCPNYDEGACLSECRADLPPQAEQCASQINSWLDCLLTYGGTYCDAAGVPKIQNSEPPECKGELLSFGKCSACVPTSADTKCDTCLKGVCCSSVQAMMDAPGYMDWAQCHSACYDYPPCEDDCDAQYPEVPPAVLVGAECVVQKCPGAC